MRIGILVLCAALGGCVHNPYSDYCAEVGAKWGKAKHDECRMVEVLVRSGGRGPVEVRIVR